jgi:hypothetical protein
MLRGSTVPVNEIIGMGVAPTRAGEELPKMRLERSRQRGGRMRVC